MQKIVIETQIAAPVERCFLLSLSIDLHVESTAQTRERVVAGVASGLIGLGETVTWEGRHFGFKLRHTSIIRAYDKPSYFQDAMTEGMFRSFEHDHRFVANEGGTMMRDELRFASPFGWVGRVVDTLVLKRYLRFFLMERNEMIRRVAESEEWRRFVPERSL